MIQEAWSAVPAELLRCCSISGCGQAQIAGSPDSRIARINVMASSSENAAVAEKIQEGPAVIA
jgi:hypothetical protein